jgi:hypothetical protein
MEGIPRKDKLQYSYMPGKSKTMRPCIGGDPILWQLYPREHECGLNFLSVNCLWVPGDKSSVGPENYVTQSFLT